MSAAYHHPAALEPEQLLAQCAVRHSRASGPGGQHRNKVETAVEITHRPTGTVGWACERRRQNENRRVAVFRLRLNLALHVRRPIDPDGTTSDLWRARVKLPRGALPAGALSINTAPQGRIAVNPGHHDFPALLAEALDAVAASGFDPRRAGAILGISPSQLVKLLAREPKALELVNQARAKRGLRELK